MRNVVILGMHRSGTSMVAGALSHAGLYVGEDHELLHDQVDNPHGFWERTDIVELDDRLLAASNGAWFNPPATLASAEANSDVHSILERLEAKDPWLIKDPRMVLTWSAWEGLLGGALPLYVYRNPLSVALSLQRRNQFPLTLSFALWEYYNRRCLEIVADREHIAISFDEVSRNPSLQMKQLEVALAERGVVLERPLVAEAYDPSLKRSVIDVDDTRLALLTDGQRALATHCEALCAGASIDSEQFGAVEGLARVTDLARALEPLSDAIETRLRLEEVTSLCEQRTRERDSGLEQLKIVESEYTALEHAHESEVDRHRTLARLHTSLEDEHASLATAHRDEVDRHEALIEEHNKLGEEHRALIEKAEFLFDLVTRTFQNLLAYETSLIGSIGRWTRRGYRLLTFQRGKSTTYEDALAEARHHFREFDLPEPTRPPGKISLAGDVARYVFENPAGSARSLSMARLRRAATVFFRSNPDDLKVWIDSRFPDRADSALAFDADKLGNELDVLELEFPRVTAPRVSIVVPVYNEYRVTITCLRSVLEHTQGADYEVIIADDCSDDLTSSIAQRVHNVHVERSNSNRGFLRNCNAAAARASGDYILFLNNDTAVCKDWLQPLLDVLDGQPDVGVTGPKLLFADGRLQEAGGIMWKDGSAWNFGRADDPDKPQYNYVKEVDYISGACLMIRRSLWQQIGGFDDRYAPAYYEDADLAFAARAAGYRVVYQPLSQVFHFEGVSNGTDPECGIKQHQVTNQSVFRGKWASVLDADHFHNADHVFWARDRSRGCRSVLFIDHYVPHHDKDAGSRSTLQYVQLMLSMGYRVLFMGANFFPHKPYTEQLQQMGVEVLIGEHMARNLDKWLAESAPYIDTIYLHRPHVAEQFLSTLLKMKPRPKIVYFGHDLHYLRVTREAKLLGDDSLLNSAASWRKRELAVFDRVDTVYYPSQAEVDEVSKQRPYLDVRAIPLYASDIAELPPYAPKGRVDLLFVGGFNHPPNVDAVVWFAKEVLPLVLEDHPEARLHIIGSNPSDTVQELQSDRIQVYGYLSDEELAAMYRRVAAAIVPLRYGAGVKGKVLEAIQMNVPLITTPTGAEGIPEAELVMTVVNGPEEFSRKIVSLFEGDSTFMQKMQNYLPWLQRNFSRRVAEQIIFQDFGPPNRISELVDALPTIAPGASEENYS